MKRNVIIVTDGDSVARCAIETATKKLGGRCISLSAGNPTMLDGDEILSLISKAKHNPVVVMVDDCGHKGEGQGEKTLNDIINSNDINILGIVAVASNDTSEGSIDVDFSIDKNGLRVNNAVDKFGNETDSKQIYGDTISIINKNINKVPVIVGIGDPGKMDRNDNFEIGSPITTVALQEILTYKNNDIQ